ncbi:DUF4212 domain-containing protein [Serpentinimonas barnesii]|uniref:DUF4212 domain-containing protein n=1 Tax=Serpentinimonas barnesii TaxID=1458427 RepID=UPI000498035F|nr:sodium/substrate symporter small subunit [Serpentinimonas barnesii]
MRDRALYWRRIKALTLLLLLLWLGVTFGVSFYARELNFAFFGWPFGYWVAAQGAIVVYGLLIALYAWVANRLDDLHGVSEPPDIHEPGRR